MGIPRGIVVAALSLLVAHATASCAPMLYTGGGTQTYLGFTIGVSSAPPPPRLVFRGRPRYHVVERSRVRVVESPDPRCDVFRYGGTYYLYTSGYWYRSHRHDGPFAVIEVRRVPRAVLTVPEHHWRHRPRYTRDDRDDGDDRRRRGRGRDGGRDRD